MADVNVQIGTQADLTGLKQIESGYTNLINKSNKAYLAMQDKSPMKLAADRQLHDRKMGDIERKANDIERRIASMKLQALDGTKFPEAGKGSLAELRDQQTRVGLQRDVMRFGGADIREAQRAAGPGIMPMVGRAGKFGARTALKYGGAIAGMAGAYSLFSGISGGVGTAGEINRAYAEAVSTTRGRSGLDYTGESKPFFEVENSLRELGETVFITAKDMLPMISVAKELGDLSREGAKGLTDVVNLGKQLGVESGVLSNLFTAGLQSGGFQKGGKYTDMAKMMMYNQNMMQRSTESLQSMSQVMAGTTHGVQGLGGFNIMNMLDALNRSGSRAYWGQGGASAMLRVDQAFRGGATETGEYFQNLALSPSFQRINEIRLQEMGGVKGGVTDWESGLYDQYITDVFKDLGAWATPETLKKTLGGMGVDADEYIEKMYGTAEGGMNKTSMQRLLDQYKLAFAPEGGGGGRLRMLSEMGAGFGMSPVDIGVISKAMESPEFEALSKQGRLTPQDILKGAGKFKELGGDIPEYTKWMKAQADIEEANIEMGKNIKKMADDLLPEVIVPLLEKISGGIKLITEGVTSTASGVSSFLEFIGIKEEPSIDEFGLSKEDYDTGFFGEKQESVVKQALDHDYGLAGVYYDKMMTSTREGIPATYSGPYASGSKAETFQDIGGQAREDIIKSVIALFTGAISDEKVVSSLANTVKVSVNSAGEEIPIIDGKLPIGGGL